MVKGIHCRVKTLFVLLVFFMGALQYASAVRYSNAKAIEGPMNMLSPMEQIGKFTVLGI